MSDEFFIGWQGKAPAKTGRFLKEFAIMAAVVAVGIAVALAALQRTVSEDARFDFGNVQEFSGILVNDPVPMLIGDEQVVYFLVNPLKHGFDPALAATYHLRQVTLKGTRIYRDHGDQEMIEVIPKSLQASASPAAASHPLGAVSDLGQVTLRGEIVDAKCYLGVMNPGNLKPHRACAIHCIQGGIPAVLLVRDSAGRARYVLLVGEEGRSLNAEILDLVAEPVRVEGRLKKLGPQLVLYTNPARFSRE